MPDAPQRGEMLTEPAPDAHRLSRGRAALCGALPIAFALLYPRLLAFAEGGGAKTFGSWAGILALVVAIAALAGGAELASSPGPTRRRRVLLALLFVTAAGLFCVFAQRDIEYSPPVIAGEAREALDGARAGNLAFAEGRGGEFLKWQFRAYNIGFKDIAIPLVAVFGPDPLVYHWMYIVIYAVVIGGTLALFGSQSASGPLQLPLPWLLLPLAALTIMVPCLRTLKWHSTCLIGALGLILIATGWDDRRGVGRFALGLLLLLYAVVHYHANLMFVAVALGLPFFERFRPAPMPAAEFWRRTAALAALALVAGGLVGWSVSLGHASIAGRLDVEIPHARATFSSVGADEIALRVLRIPSRYLAWPTLAALVLGIAVAVRRVRSSAATAVVLAALAGALAIDIRFLYIGDNSWQCRLLIPLLWLVAAGVLEFHRRLSYVIRGPLVANLVAGLSMAGFLAAEWSTFAAKNIGRNFEMAPRWNLPHAQPPGIVRHLIENPDPAPRETLHLIAEPMLPPERGGFGQAIPLDELDPDVRVWNLREYRNETELAALLDAVEGGRTRWQRAVLYYRIAEHPFGDDPAAHLPFLRGRALKSDLLDLPTMAGTGPLGVTRVVFTRRY